VDVVVEFGAVTKWRKGEGGQGNRDSKQEEPGNVDTGRVFFSVTLASNLDGDEDLAGQVVAVRA
jgi:hypothetical protein